ncbi:TetR/AcrR family transcriptional regulator [Pseudomonas cichorii]|nr:TetR family transcriptional regulator [Pseudomonas cichorii]MBX8508400.1 TetR/AcrR family transcriptional regulator [Pseudomonas cichorii]MBX8523261.1 TetR/AcrR family transcriptional regulator [Pseudomonas cichorii]MBX8550063.1 TetR/AcrR family transcriptional regulator [Pseudomonas cichorii]MBX8570184.1 TetR/AcrR family transcriptional regulator [Pseudomonas cichorii]MBX8584710.1 TetR/AcrR family transcriptional regulator [Pseudomonas cichorii]
MRVSKAQAQANRAHIVETASRLFRERGYDGVGVADLMAAAGFTHGGFYKHFGSKADLMAEAAASSFAKSVSNSENMSVEEFFTLYLSRQHRDARHVGCTMAALCGDAARQTPEVRTTFAEGIENMLEKAGSEGSDTGDADQQRTRMISMLAHAVGAIVLSRSCPDDSPLADEIIEACRAEILANFSTDVKS